MLSPLNWLHVFTHRQYWDFNCSSHKRVNNRCYCDGGRTASCSLTLAGFYVRIWYSHFTGEIPCPCDTAFETLFGEEEVSVENVLRESSP
jgi:hypothetical protein